MKPDLEQLRIAHPCSRKWDELAPVGSGEQKRHCADCALDVHDLAAYTSRGAERLLAKRKRARLCLRVTHRADGSLVLSPSLWKRVGTWAASLMAMFSLLPGCADTTPGTPPGTTSPNAAAPGTGPDSRPATTRESERSSSHTPDPKAPDEGLLQGLGGLAFMGYMGDE